MTHKRIKNNHKVLIYLMYVSTFRLFLPFSRSYRGFKQNPILKNLIFMPVREYIAQAKNK